MLKHPFFVPCALFAFVLAYLLGPAANPIVTRGEGREALVVQAMMNQDNLILPLRNGVTIPSKPPLFHWIAYVSARAVGSLSERAIRFPSILAAALALPLFYLLFSRRISRKDALFAVLILLASMDFLRTASAARVDMVFSLWLSIGTWLLFEVCDSNESPTKNWRTLAAGVCMGLAVLTKGPAGVALPIAVIAAYSVVTIPVRQFPFAPCVLCGLIGLAIAAPWYFAAYEQGGQHFLDVHLMRENVARIVALSDYDVGHESSRISVLGMILSGLLPWSFFFPLIVANYWHYRSNLRVSDPALVFCIVWALFYLVFFALTTSRRNVYLLPSYPAYAYLFARSLGGQSFESPQLLRLAGWLCALFTGLLAIATLDLFAIRWFDLERILSNYGASANTLDVVTNLSRLEVPYLLLIIFALLAYTRGTLQIFAETLKPAIYSLVAGQLILGFAVHSGVMSKISQSQSPKAELPAMLQGLGHDAPLYQFRHDFYSINFYSNRIVATVDSKPKLEEGKTGYIFVSEEELSDARAALDNSEIFAQSVGPIANGKGRLFILKFS